ncbi:MAG: epoxyqueuosine reductase, partial [Firmicutes bacterium]|nr:epoxyqueuosine reductase [Bacillota bacterium]
MERQRISREMLQAFITQHLAGAPDNLVTAQTAVDPADIGTPMFAEPLVCVGRADDPLWEELKKPEAVGSIFRAPREWMPEAKTVISVFGPWSDHVVETNAQDPVYPSSAWISAYHTGGALIKRLSVELVEWLQPAGYSAIAPAMTENFRFVYEDGSDPEIPAGIAYASNWSERHAAFVCGHGTFGLSRGIITRKGMAGRFCSVVTDLELEPDVRDYTGVYEYCTNCGMCIANCPPQAISFEEGKKHPPCNAWLTDMKKRNGVAGC